MKKLLEKLNGKKKFVVIPAATLSAVGILLFNINTQVSTNAETLKYHSTCIDDMKMTPIKIVKIEQKVDGLTDTFEDFRMVQRTINTRQDTYNMRVEDKIDRLINAIVK